MYRDWAPTFSVKFTNMFVIKMQMSLHQNSPQTLSAELSSFLLCKHGAINLSSQYVKVAQQSPLYIVQIDGRHVTWPLIFEDAIVPPPPTSFASLSRIQPQCVQTSQADWVTTENTEKLIGFLNKKHQSSKKINYRGEARSRIVLMVCCVAAL